MKAGTANIWKIEFYFISMEQNEKRKRSLNWIREVHNHEHPPPDKSLNEWTLNSLVYTFISTIRFQNRTIIMIFTLQNNSGHCDRCMMNEHFSCYTTNERIAIYRSMHLTTILRFDGDWWTLGWLKRSHLTKFKRVISVAWSVELCAIHTVDWQFGPSQLKE